MDFIEGLPNSHGKQVIFVVVDRLSKYAYFMPMSHPYIAIWMLLNRSWIISTNYIAYQSRL